MTREEAIKMLNRLLLYCDECPHGDCEKCVEAINMAIEALEEETLQNLTKPYKSDLISRQAAIDEMGYCQTFLFDTRDKDKKISLEDALYALEQLPSAQPKRGYWLEAREEDPCWFICSECKTMVDADYNYCPHCGARMESDGE